MQKLLQQKGKSFVHLIEQIQLVSPLATIARGYSIARNEKGKMLNSITQVKANEKILVQISDGTINAKVVSVQKTD